MIALITSWEKYNADADMWGHNHVNSGWEFGYTPKPKHPSQEGWSKGLWRSRHGFLYSVDGKIPHVVIA